MPHDFFGVNMQDDFLELSSRLEHLGKLTGTCCVWKRSQYCLTELRLSDRTYMHTHPFCKQVKSGSAGIHPCLQHDTGTMASMVQKSEGRKAFCLECPARAMEFIVPVRRSDRILGVVIFGPFRSGALHELPLPMPMWRADLADSLQRMTELLITPLVEKIYSYYPQKEIHDNRIQRVLNYIAANYQRNISIEELASLVFLSPSHLSHLFTRCCGMNFSAYLVGFRLQVAYDLLQYTKLPIYSLAEKVGFSNPNHFSSSFRKKYHCSPNQWRKTKRQLSI
jgi:AraC-like DNA-binding protein